MLRQDWLRRVGRMALTLPDADLDDTSLPHSLNLGDIAGDGLLDIATQMQSFVHFFRC